MSEPIRVYPTETPGLYETEDGRRAVHGVFAAWSANWCLNCLRFMDVPSSEHWIIADRPYCRHCVQVVGQAVAP